MKLLELEDLAKRATPGSWEQIHVFAGDILKLIDVAKAAGFVVSSDDNSMEFHVDMLREAFRELVKN